MRRRFNTPHREHSRRLDRPGGRVGRQSYPHRCREDLSRPEHSLANAGRRRDLKRDAERGSGVEQVRGWAFWPPDTARDDEEARAELWDGDEGGVTKASVI
jgi:hypothetical protein